MIFYHLKSLLALCIFMLVHIFAYKARVLSPAFNRRFLSIGSGIAIAYVFLDIMPKIARYEPIVTDAVRKFFPFFERHAYVMALFGFLLFYLVDRSKSLLDGKRLVLFLSLSSYALLNLFVGYAIVDVENPEVRPIVMFTIAMSLHYFVIDFSLSETLSLKYDHIAKWILVLFLLLGWCIGIFIEIPAAAVGLLSAFVAGGVIMNVMRHELPLKHLNSTFFFLLSAFIYAWILLSVGS